MNVVPETEKPYVGLESKIVAQLFERRAIGTIANDVEREIRPFIDTQPSAPKQSSLGFRRLRKPRRVNCLAEPAGRATGAPAIISQIDSVPDDFQPRHGNAVDPAGYRGGSTGNGNHAIRQPCRH